MFKKRKLKLVSENKPTTEWSTYEIVRILRQGENEAQRMESICPELNKLIADCMSNENTAHKFLAMQLLAARSAFFELLSAFKQTHIRSIK